MNKKTIVFLLIISSFFFAVQSAAAEGEIEIPQRSITVRGEGSVSAAPDIVRLNLGVQSMNSNLSAAIEDNNSRINLIIEVIEKYEIDAADFSTSNFSVYYQQPYNPEQSPENGVYNVNNNIFITLRDIEKIGNFIQDALDAGANQFYGLEYAVSEPDPLRKDARKLAVEDAKTLALETAEMAGVSLGRIISIEETPWYGGMPMYSEGFGGLKTSNSLITAPGEKIIDAQVTVKFEIE